MEAIFTDAHVLRALRWLQVGERREADLRLPGEGGEELEAGADCIMLSTLILNKSVPPLSP